MTVSAWDLSFKNFLGNLFRPFAGDLSLGNFNLGTFVWDFGLAFLAWTLLVENFTWELSLGAVAWELSLGIFCLEPLDWNLCLGDPPAGH